MKFITIIFAILMMSINAQAYDREEFAFMKDFLNSIQQRTFDANREFCGHLMVDKDDYYVASKPKKGREDSCLANDPPNGYEIIASYHTHGAFSEEADSELPSSSDLQADISEGVDGWVATPGGRIWFNDSQTGLATMVCGRNCIISDPYFDASLLDPVKKSYNLKALLKRHDL